MKRNPSANRSERGVALFVSLLALLLIAAVSTALLLLASGESSMAGHHRYTARVSYAASAGLEEARARMLDYHPTAFSKLSPPVAFPSAVGQVVYITNPAAGETVNPTDLSASNPYADTEYQTEFGSPVSTATVTTASSTQPVLSGLTSIPYKWVRMTVKTERAANADINGDSILDNTIPVRYDGKRQNLSGLGSLVYRLTALAVLPNGTRRMTQLDVAGINGPGFNYAIASGGECEVESTGTNTVNGNVRCNSEVELNGTLNLNGGTLSTAGNVQGSGTINLTGSNQVRANTGVTGTVVGGATPNVVNGLGTVASFNSPATPTAPPLAADTIPNPNASNMIPLVTLTNPQPQCVSGNIVFDLGNASPPKMFEFNGTAITLTAPCGGVTTLDGRNFPANVQFTGKGSIWFSNTGASEVNIKFNNNFGTPSTPVEINIIARPRDNSVGKFEVEFAGTTNNIKGLIYVHGEIETEPVRPTGGVPGACPVLPNQMFNVSGSIIAFGTDSEFEAENCLNNFNVTYNPTQLGTINPPPGFNGLLTTGIASVPILNWRDMN